MRDVAAKAGVSVATVSRALAGSPAVAPDARGRVLTAAAELGYVASRLPANLRAKNVRILALVVGNVRNAYFPELIDGCVEAAQRAGFPLIFGDSNEDPERESEILEQLASERVSGVALATSTGPTPGLRRLLDLGIAVVAVDRRLRDLEVDTVTVAGIEGACSGVEHLIALGHRRIGLVVGPVRMSTMADREQGYRRALAEAGIAYDPGLVVQGDLQEATAQQAVRDLMRVDDPPTALLTCNDLSTIGTLRGLRGLGLRVPGDVSLVGFDDVIGGDLLDPPLTVIQQPVFEIGCRAIDVLIQRIADAAGPRIDIALPTRLVVRASTASRGGPASVEV